MEVTNLDLRDFVPATWLIVPSDRGLQLLAPSATDAHYFHEGVKPFLLEAVKRWGQIEISWRDCQKPLKVNMDNMDESSKSLATSETRTSGNTVNSYAPNKIASDASPEAIHDFYQGKTAEGLIVTATSMRTDKCLSFNHLQVTDRGGNWTADDWAGKDFKILWRDSFLPRRTNYYGELVERVVSEGFLPEFYYKIRRPSGALAEYYTNYYYVENFMGTPARIGVSRVGDWAIVESAPDGSEVIGAKGAR